MLIDPHEGHIRHAMRDNVNEGEGQVTIEKYNPRPPRCGGAKQQPDLSYIQLASFDPFRSFLRQKRAQDENIQASQDLLRPMIGNTKDFKATEPLKVARIGVPINKWIEGRQIDRQLVDPII